MIKIIKEKVNNGGYDIYKRYKQFNITHCYLYVIEFNDNSNKFFKVGVSNSIKRPNNFIDIYNNLSANLILLEYGEAKLICEIEKFIHKKMKLPIYKQNYIKNGRSEIYDIQYLNQALSYIQNNLN